MRLKSFATYGFKSFADKTELSFDKGITAVVGPNGSGKSNISDAIRWVLGEQSAKYLRGSKMEDVIFSGSGKRRALGVAEVTIDLDNSDHALPLDFEQVSLTRRIFRSGESEYAINKKSCRLKDIIDLMADTGLGKGSMSIIGQNKIDEILNSRPEDRRSLFEEAAGIAKYRLRKKDAVRKLDDTAKNLTRINDIRSEVDAQVEPLAQAAEKTRQFNALSEDLRRCRLSVLLRRLDEMEAKTRELNAKKEAAGNEYAARAAGLSKQRAAQALLQQELDKLAEEFSRLQDDIKDKETRLEKLHGSQKVLDERVSQSQRAGRRLDEHNERLQQQVAGQEARLQVLAADFDAAEKKRAAAGSLVRELEYQRGEQVKLLEAAKKRNDELQSQFFSGMQELLALRNDLRSLEEAQEQRVRRREALKKSIEEAEAAAGQQEEEYNSLLERKAQSVHNMELLQRQGTQLRAEYDANKGSLQATMASHQQCQRQAAAADAREQALKRLQQSYEGFGYGIKAVMKAREQWSAQVVGVAAELIHVDDKYVAAIETALGEGAQNIVMRSAAAAKAAIGYLKSSGGGRATFLPLDTVQRRMPGREEEALAQLPGVLGYAVDLITYEAEAENAIRFLLGRVLVAENIDAALAAAKAARYRLRVVTLDGDVVNAGGSLTGGSRKRKEGYLARNVEIAQAATQVKELHQQLLTWQEQLEEREAIEKQQSGQLQQLAERLRKEQLAADGLELKLKQTEEQKKRDDERLLLLLDDRSSVTAAYMANRDKLKELRAAVAEREGQDSEAKTLLEDIKREIARFGSAVTALDNQLQDAKIALETSAAKAQLISSNMQNMDADALRLQKEIAEGQQEKERLQQVIAGCAEEKRKLQGQCDALLTQLQQMLGGKDDYSTQRGELLDRQLQAEAEITALQKQVDASEGGLRQAELELARHESSCSHVKEQLKQDYQLDEAAARALDLQDLQGLTLAALQKQESELTLAIAELGPINAAAIEEYNAVRERSEFLRRQYSDLCEAKDNLEAVIAEINSGMSKRFKEAFAKINEYFAQCYAKLFGGGTAVLLLTEPDNLLDSGIDIHVQPPGKKLQSLYLMSGGERALTVIALLFALLSYQPSPFCVLDEIDAPLDDANIQRFASFLRDYASSTQFIVITHRKGTMECADIMYGVTMEESGVSKLLSVKINAKENV